MLHEATAQQTATWLCSFELNETVLMKGQV